MGGTVVVLARWEKTPAKTQGEKRHIRVREQGSHLDQKPYRREREKARTITENDPAHKGKKVERTCPHFWRTPEKEAPSMV